MLERIMTESVFKSVRRTTAIIALVIAAALGAVIVTGIWKAVGAFKSPLATKRVDRTTPALMLALTDMARIEGSSGSFQVVVDIQDEAKYVPKALKGERIIYLAQGTASGTVDLAKLSSNSITTDETAKTVTIVVPHAEVSNLRIDLTKSKVLSHDRGLLDRIGGAVGEAPPMHPDLVKRAEQELKKIAAESELRMRAEENTKTLLTRIATGLGYTKVTVEFGSGGPKWPTIPTTQAA
jgi:Protein of unknown function (DUF4230)